MDLSFRDIRKKEVINVPDGKSLGYPIDIVLQFPEGVIVGIVVPGCLRKGILKLFDRTELFIDDTKIIKIGGDVILVDLKNGDFCFSPSVKTGRIRYPHKKQCPPPPPEPPFPSQEKPCPPPDFCGEDEKCRQLFGEDADE